MTGKTKARVAFWVSQTMAVSVAVGAIFFAARIGFQQALAYDRYQELRHTRNALVAVENELAINERNLHAALADWAAVAFHQVFVVTHAWDAAHDGDELFDIAPDTLAALGQAYAPTLTGVAEGVHQGVDPRAAARELTWLVDQVGAARALLERDIAALESAMSGYGVSDVAAPRRYPAGAGAALGAEEQAFADKPPTEGWQVGPAAYTGAIDAGFAGEVHFASLAVAAHPGGPGLLAYHVTLPGDALLVAVHLCLLDAAPVESGQWLTPGSDDAAIRDVLGCSAGTLARHASLDLDGAIVVPAGFRWAYIVVEDNAGARHLLDRVDSWKVGKDDPAAFWMNPPPGALTAPR